MIEYGYGQIKLGPILEKSLPMLFDMRNNEENYKYFRQYRPLTLEEHVQWFRSLHNNDKVRMFLAGRCGSLVGVCGLTDIDRVNSRAEISCYSTVKEEPVEHDMIMTLLRYAFERENLNSVYAECFETNAPKLKILDELEADAKVKIPARYFREGRYISVYHYTFLR